MSVPGRRPSRVPPRVAGTTKGRARVLVILGPTAVGKSLVAIGVGQKLGGEVISADSRAFFRGLDIATDKVSASLRQAVPHHLIDIVDATGRYDAMTFRRDVDRLVPEIHGRGRIPILCGGGTLYLGAVLRGIFTGPSADLALRRELSLVPQPELYARVGAVDPQAAKRIHPNDRLRLVRALEVHVLTGRPISAWQDEAKSLPYDFTPIGLSREREDHKAAIAVRVDAMLERGLIPEVKGLRERGLDRSAQAFRTIGVRETFAFLDGELSQAELRDEIVRNTWSLVRRQLSWFRADNGVTWIDVTDRSSEDVAGEIVRRFEEEREHARGA